MLISAFMGYLCLEKGAEQGREYASQLCIPSKLASGTG